MSLSSITYTTSSINKFLNFADTVKLTDGKFSNDADANNEISRTQLKNAGDFAQGLSSKVNNRINIGNQILAYVANAKKEGKINDTLFTLVTLIVEQTKTRLLDDKKTYDDYLIAYNQIKNNDTLFFASHGDSSTLTFGGDNTDLGVLNTKFGVDDDGKVESSASEVTEQLASIAATGTNLVTLLNRADIKAIINGKDDDDNEGMGPGLKQGDIDGAIAKLDEKIAGTDVAAEKAEFVQVRALLELHRGSASAFINSATNVGGKLRLETQDLIQQFSTNGTIAAADIVRELDPVNQASYSDIRSQFEDSLRDNQRFSYTKSEISAMLVDGNGNSLMAKELNDFINGLKNAGLNLESPNIQAEINDKINELTAKYAGFEAVLTHFGNLDANDDGRIELSELKDANNDGVLDVA